MNALVRSALAGQFGAAMKMFRGCLDRADAGAWLAPVGKYPFWQVAYHTLVVTDLYLAPAEEQFQPQPFHREGYDDLGPPPDAPDRVTVVDRPYDKATLVGYADLCRERARQAIA